LIQQAINDLTAEIERLEAAVIVTQAKAANDDDAIIEWSAIDARLRFSRVYLAHLNTLQAQSKVQRVGELGKQISEADEAAIKARSLLATARIARDAEQTDLNIRRTQPGSDRSENQLAQAIQRFDEAREQLAESERRRAELVAEFEALGGVLQKAPTSW
jgi:hypothetical protein